LSACFNADMCPQLFIYRLKFLPPDSGENSHVHSGPTTQKSSSSCDFWQPVRHILYMDAKFEVSPLPWNAKLHFNFSQLSLSEVIYCSQLLKPYVFQNIRDQEIIAHNFYMQLLVVCIRTTNKLRFSLMVQTFTGI